MFDDGLVGEGIQDKNSGVNHAGCRELRTFVELGLSSTPVTVACIFVVMCKWRYLLGFD